MQTVRRIRPFQMGMLLLFVVGAALAAAAVAGARAEGPGAESAAGATAAFQYVGLDRTLARVEPATGRVWILTHPEVSPNVSLLSLIDRRGFRWRELGVEPDRPSRTPSQAQRP